MYHNNYRVNAFYINMLPCSLGFIQLSGVCICDPILNLKLLPITTCDINHQTILRPDLLVVGYLLTLSMALTNIMSFLIVHYTTVYLNHHNSISPLLTHSVSLIGLVCCNQLWMNNSTTKIKTYTCTQYSTTIMLSTKNNFQITITDRILTISSLCISKVMDDCITSYLCIINLIQ